MSKPNAKKSGGKKSSGSFYTAAIVILAVVLAVMLFAGSEKVSSLEIIGADGFDSGSVQRASGIRYGAKLKDLDAAEIERNVNATGYLKFVSLDKLLPAVKLTVEARTPCAVIEQGGMFITIDEDGFVIDRSVDDPHLVSIRNGRFSRTDPGTRLESTVSGLTETVSGVLKALKDTGSIGLYSDIDLADTMSIILRTDSAMVIEIGAMENISERLSLVKDVLREIENDGYTGGTVNATTTNITYKK